MQTLNLGEIQLPASRFPEPAVVYVCDKCGRNITKHLHPGRAHVATPIGPPWYTCRCGQKYLSGAVEWDNLGEWQRRSRVVEITTIAVMTFALLGLLVLLIYEAIEHHNEALIVLCAVLAPLGIMIVWFFIAGALIPLFEIASSVLRTRMR
jgi:uncharacterized integral membrane protein